MRLGFKGSFVKGIVSQFVSFKHQLFLKGDTPYITCDSTARKALGVPGASELAQK